MKLFFLLFIILSCAQIQRKRITDKVSILQGVTQETSVEFSLIQPKEAKYRVVLQTLEGEPLEAEISRTISRDDSNFAILKLLFIKEPEKTYNLYVFDGDKLLDQRLVGGGQRVANRLNLVVASCMDDDLEEAFGIWDEVAKKAPEYLLLIGDNVYADKNGKAGGAQTSPEMLWKRYVDVRLSLPIYFQEKLIPTHALWDDHDYGQNNSGVFYEHKEASKEIFNAFWAQSLSEENWFKSYGVGGLLTLGDFNLYFLDARTFRSPEKTGTHLGLEQESWFLEKIKQENNPSLIVKGDQFFGGYHQFESFEGDNPENFQRFVQELKSSKTPFVFVSGDRHMSEIMQFPRALFTRPSFEITSSPIHAKLFPNSNDKNPWRVVANNDRHNFTYIENEARDSHWFLEVEDIDGKGNVVYRRELAVYIQDLQNNLNEGRKRRSGRRRYQRNRSRRR